VAGAVRRHWRLVAVIVAAVVVLGVAYAASGGTEYQATASLTVADPRGPGVLAGHEPTDPERYVGDQLAVFRSATLGARAAELGTREKPPLERTAQWFLDHTSARASAEDNNLLRVSFRADTRPEAMTGLRVIVNAYRAVVAAATGEQANAVKRQLDASIASLDIQLRALAGVGPAANAEIQQLQATRGQLAARREEVTGEAQHPSDGVLLALLPNDATSDAKAELLRFAVLAFAFGAVIGIAVAYALSYRKRVFVEAREPELVLGAPLLVDVSRQRARDLEESFSIAASLLVDLGVASDDRRSLTVASAERGSAASHVASHLAAAFARDGLRVVLIDATEPAGPVAAPGAVIDVDARVSGVSRSAPATSLVPAVANRSVVVSAGVPIEHVREDLSSRIRELEKEFDVVVVDAPAFLDSLVAAQFASATRRVVAVVTDGASVTACDEFGRRARLARVDMLGYVYCDRRFPSRVPPVEGPPPPKRAHPPVAGPGAQEASG
jgi:hypothetical protein